jgi:homoserine O-succinyltransferase/O-acetyltransferase
MPVILDLPRSSRACPMRTGSHRVNRPLELTPRSANEVAIGLVNNMSDGALEATETQFALLLDSASGGLSVRLSLYYFPNLPRSEAAASHLRGLYATTESLWDASLDGLIVTGREPLSACLRDEPYWEDFVRVLNWSRENTASTVWSCLAAHAAVLHMDGIERQKSERKHCGVFDCLRISDHPLTAGVPPKFRLPHSRWNGLPEADLIRSGYTILTRTDVAGVDCFAKEGKSLFVFFQGHPEYHADTLTLEYRRDVGRYLRQESSMYPMIPSGCFDQTTVWELRKIQQEAAARSHEETLGLLAKLLAPTGRRNGWSATATTLYRNWLQEVHRRKVSCHAEVTDAAMPGASPNPPLEPVGAASP